MAWTETEKSVSETHSDVAGVLSETYSIFVFDLATTKVFNNLHAFAEYFLQGYCNMYKLTIF